MKYFSLSVILICIVSCSFSQERDDVKKNSLELYFPVSHFFDGTETNWTGLMRPRQLKQTDDRKILPVTLGLQYTRRINEREGLRFSLLRYEIIYPLNDRRIKIDSRYYSLLSAGYIRSFSIVDKLLLDFVGELNFRYGGESVEEVMGIYDVHVHEILLSDFGLSAGGRIEYSLPLNFLISGEVKYTRFVYRHSEGVYDFIEDRKIRASEHILTLKLGIGYRF